MPAILATSQSGHQTDWRCRTHTDEGVLLMAAHPRHYEVWDSTSTGANIVGHADSLPAALMLYLRTRKTAPGHTINLLVDEPTSAR
jgi:hypothetical protein